MLFRSMELIKKETPFLSFPAIDQIPYVKHGFSTRLGGVSKGCFHSLNLSFVRGDDEDAVATNYDRILSSMGMDGMMPVFSDQVHDTVIHKVVSEDSDSIHPYGKHLKGIDGLITNVAGYVLITSYADCVPIYLVDPVNRAIGLSHSGWKGTVNKIGKKTVEAMTKEYGTNPADIIAAIGPSICFECYEISADVAEQFKSSFSKEIGDKILYKKNEEKYHLDLWLTNRYILEKAGVLPENISVSEVCTNCNAKLLFSHRASKGERGNLAAFLALE